MSWGVVAVGIGSAVIGGVAANSAAKKQAGAARDATEAQERSMERQIELQEPWRQAGGLGLNALLYGLGLSPSGTFTPGAGGGGVGGAGGLETPEQIRERLTAQYVTNTPTPGGGELLSDGESGTGMMVAGTGQMSTERRIDEAALSAAVRAEYARQRAAEAQRLRTATATARRDPNYGNLLRDFSMADFQRDPGYQFRFDEGQRALDRAAAAGGRFNSGRAAKDLMRFGQGLATEEYGNAFNRFSIQQGNRFNRLASISGVGQTATNQQGQAVSNFGQQAGSNAIGAGNALAAGRVGMANAFTGAANQGMSSYQSNQMMNRFFPQGGGVPANPYAGGMGGYGLDGGMSWYD